MVYAEFISTPSGFADVPSPLNGALAETVSNLLDTDVIASTYSDERFSVK